MPSTVTDRLYGENSAVAIKAPCVAVSSANIPLSGVAAFTTPSGSYTPSEGDRILVIGQTDQTTNGIYNASGTAWQRTGDFDGTYDVVQGTIVTVLIAAGTGLAFYQLTTADPVIGTTVLAFSALAQNPNLNYPTTAAEQNAGVVPSVLTYAPGNIWRYAPSGAATTDWSGPIQKAINQAAQAGGSPVYVPAGTYTIAAAAAALSLVSNLRLYGDGPSSLIQFQTVANQDCIAGSGVTDVQIRQLKLQVMNQQASGSNVGVIAFRANSKNCSVTDCEIVGATLMGVLIDSSSYCRIANNYFHDFIYGTGNNDSADIRILADTNGVYNADYNIIENNECFGGNNHGIAIENSSTAPNTVYMRKNIVHGNRVGAHTAYGILAYTHIPGDYYIDISDNYVENISGSSPAQGGAAGAGIYVAGMGAVRVAGNTIYNCCTATNATGLAPGGIGINAGTGSPIDIVGNQIFDMAQGNATAGISIAGIFITSTAGTTPGGVNVTGNTISQSVNGDLSYGIYVNTAAGFTGFNISGNAVNILNSIAGTRGIAIFAATANIQGVSICGNTVNGCSSAGIWLTQTNPYTVQDYTINGNTVYGGGAASVPIYISGATNGAVTGNRCSATTTQALYLNASTGTRIANNSLSTTGGVIFQTAGACTNSMFELSNSITSIGGVVQNGGTGCNVRYFAGASPATGSNQSQIGDVAYCSNPTSASQMAWVCTTAGTPGTWTALTLP